MGKILGLDIGSKRVGVAVSDELAFLAHPLKTITWKGYKLFVEEIQNLISEQSVTKIVVGVPYTLEGNVSKKTEEVLRLIKKLRKNVSIPIIEVDESLSTKRAHDVLHRVGKKPSKKRQTIDQIAAVFILQDYLDSIR
ncbi:Holliday junction resolvase [Caldithrix abyssi DSM 13497]|uniref:Putative pre-16S rRNA nuclease n=1 Tax=Caldithrix abyssi DSM 13497 TaxID=880073 RepID=H1XXP3_CALAY|nr:Holliday junction resolvase RuvX [Caldithrix abyssi]APF19591.1 putative holliday junction resolvase [Caldithrix abyssi DSM 13497]EHO39716.1 Holliday junction resolvase [Caldithrix abyssi DSM 13497]